MNQKDFLKLTGAEIREAIAKAKGWEMVFGYIDEAASTQRKFWIGPDGSCVRTTVLPDWDTKIEDAWTLITPDWFAAIDYIDLGESWWVWYRDAHGGYSNHIAAPTAPLALCYGYLFSMEGKNE